MQKTTKTAVSFVEFEACVSNQYGTISSLYAHEMFSDAEILDEPIVESVKEIDSKVEEEAKEVCITDSSSFDEITSESTAVNEFQEAAPVEQVAEISDAHNIDNVVTEIPEAEG